MAPIDPNASEHSTFRSSAARGFAWTGLQSVFARLLSLLTFVVLARLLTPEDYGVAAIAQVIVSVLGLLATAGLSQAVVQREALDNEDLSSVAWAALMVSSLLTASQIALSWRLAEYFELPELQLVLCVTAPIYLVLGVAAVPMGLLQRHLRFREVTRVNISANVAATAVGLAAAVFGAGYWALVLQSMWVPLQVATAVLRMSGFRPGRQFSLRRLASIFRVSQHFMWERCAALLNEQSDKFVVGRVLGSATLGLYFVSYRVVYMLLDVMSETMRIAALPAFARMRSRDDTRRSAYLASVRISVTLAWPCFAFLGTNAGSLVPVVFGEVWESAAPAVSVLCVYGGLQFLAQLNTVVLQAGGRTRPIVWTAAGCSALQIIALVAVAPFGVLAVGAVLVCRAAFYLIASTVLVARDIGHVTFGTLAGAVGAPLLGSAAVAGATLLSQGATFVPGAIWELALAAGLSVIAYSGVLILCGKPHLRALTNVLWLLRSRDA